MRYTVVFEKDDGINEPNVYEVYTNSEEDALALANILSKHCYVWISDDQITDDVPIIYQNF